jgi:NAD-dependent dihydropyrimidine dehydrogenase PreA subunit
MSLYALTETAVGNWVNQLLKEQDVIAPVAERDKFKYAHVSSGDEVRLDFNVTTQPPKRYFLPECETLVRYSGATEAYTPVIEASPFILFGVHPYDVAAISQMDEVFQRDNADPNYLAKRTAATIIACDVFKPSTNCFAACMGTATVDDGFDILLTPLGDVYLAESITTKGTALLEELNDKEPASTDLIAKREQFREDAQRFLRMHELQCSTDDLPYILEQSYQHPIWEKKARRCYSCASCNLVCPTCYCFDIQDDPAWDLDSCQRNRVWDGCLLEDFAIVAGNHNFRKDRTERFRHRYYRKGKYMWERNGHIACVGCGRCITACTANIANPVEIYNTILEDG